MYLSVVVELKGQCVLIHQSVTPSKPEAILGGFSIKFPRVPHLLVRVHVHSSKLFDALHRKLRCNWQWAGLAPLVAVVIAERSIHKAVGRCGIKAKSRHLIRARRYSDFGHQKQYCHTPVH